MGPKKDKASGSAEGVEGEDPTVFLSNYTKFCK